MKTYKQNISIDKETLILYACVVMINHVHVMVILQRQEVGEWETGWAFQLQSVLSPALTRHWWLRTTVRNSVVITLRHFVHCFANIALHLTNSLTHR